ncbi:MAG: P-loop NTPase fold protein [Succinivibrio sp.]|nr:P-loop NTPase fold protein [Succinivibrio sp.]
MSLGFSDLPVDSKKDDIFEVSNYVNALSAFIKECTTPMTIAIQGTWGAGKTSLMNLIREELGNSVDSIWFNTWQYSQFNMEDELTLTLLSSLSEALEPEQSQRANIGKSILSLASRTALKIGVSTASHFLGEEVGEALQDAGSEAKSIITKNKEQDLSPVQAVKVLKKQFQEAVLNKIGKTSKDRLVFFIDDLDRLNPGKAVEVLEILKLFLDCDKCVFVLAIDYSVVSQGVRVKYGDSIDDSKGRSFFDKIIQVPFKMPTAQYNLKNYVGKFLESIDIKNPSEQMLSNYSQLIEYSIGSNPRAMKRIFNAYLLLSKVTKIKGEQSDWDKEMLFAVLCLQLSFEELYLYLAKNLDECNSQEFMERLYNIDSYRDAEDGDEDNESSILTDDNLKLIGKKYDDQKLRNLLKFMKVFVEVIDQNGDGDLSEDELNDFYSVINISSITAAVDNVEVSAKTTYTEEDHVQRALPKIQQIYQDLKQKVMTLGNISFDPKKVYIAMKVKGHSFALVIFRKKKFDLALIMPFGALNDPKELFSKVGRDKGKVGWNYSLEMRDEIELDYVFEMVKQSYDIANKDN